MTCLFRYRTCLFRYRTCLFRYKTYLFRYRTCVFRYRKPLPLYSHHRDASYQKPHCNGCQVRRRKAERAIVLHQVHLESFLHGPSVTSTQTCTRGQSLEFIINSLLPLFISIFHRNSIVWKKTYESLWAMKS